MNKIVPDPPRLIFSARSDLSYEETMVHAINHLFAAATMAREMSWRGSRDDTWELAVQLGIANDLMQAAVASHLDA